jgi:hypothetical protein
MDAPVNAAMHAMLHSDVWQKVRLDVQQYMYATGALKTATGFCIGMATKEGIDRLLAVSVHPLLLYVTERVNATLAGRGGGAGHRILKKTLNILGIVIRTLLEWAVVVVVAYLALELFFGRKIIGLSSAVVTAKKQDDFATSKQAASDTTFASPGIMPT